MNRNEIAAWLQVITGIGGLIFTVMTATPSLNAISQASAGTGLPSGFAGAQGAIQVFLTVLLIIVCLAFLGIGLAVLLGGLFRQIGASSPYHAAFCVIIAIVCGAVALTLAVVGTLLWVLFMLLAMCACVVAGIAQVDAGKETFWTLTCGGIAGAVFVTGIVFFAASLPARNEQVARDNAAIRAEQRNAAAAQKAGQGH